MKILILGGDSMIGHQLAEYFQGRHQTKVTLRQRAENYQKYGTRFTSENAYYQVDAMDDHILEKLLKDCKPEVVINTFGIVKQRDAASEFIPSISMNALLPHKLAKICAEINARMITFATDCIFSGEKGNYQPDDFPDARDLYGRTKFLGEIHDLKHCVTIRCSFIGLELANKKNLVEWFLAQKGEITGYTQAIYTGLTTFEMAKLIEKIIVEYKELSGLCQVASEKIDKYTLLTALAKKLGRTDIKIISSDQFHCDRSLDGSEFVNKTGYVIPGWDVMLNQLVEQINARKVLE